MIFGVTKLLGSEAIGSLATRVGRTAGIIGAATAAHQLPRSNLFTQYYMGVHGERDETAQVISHMQTIGTMGAAAILGVGAYRLMGPFGRKHGGPSKRTPSQDNDTVSMFGGIPGSQKAKPFYNKHPFLTAGGVAAGVGFGVNAGFGMMDRRGIVGEGRITAIHSSRNGGMDPSLNLSTQGLVQSLHNNQRRF